MRTACKNMKCLKGGRDYIQLERKKKYSWRCFDFLPSFFRFILTFREKKLELLVSVNFGVAIRAVTPFFSFFLCVAKNEEIFGKSTYKNKRQAIKHPLGVLMV